MSRSMQELLVRFEPPDVYGVPPSKQMVTTKEGADNILQFTSAPKANIQLASLPMASLQSTTPPTPFQSLPPFSKEFVVCFYLLWQPFKALSVQTLLRMCT